MQNVDDVISLQEVVLNKLVNLWQVRIIMEMVSYMEIETNGVTNMFVRKLVRLCLHVIQWLLSYLMHNEVISIYDTNCTIKWDALHINIKIVFISMNTMFILILYRYVQNRRYIDSDFYEPR